MNTRSPYVWAIAAALALILSTQVAWAHPKILSVEPPPDARLEVPPTRLRIAFNERLEAISVLALRDSRGREVATGGAPLPDDPTTLALDLPPLAPGVYTMVWTVVGSDGHIVKGNAAFTVLGAPAAQGTPAAASPVPEGEPPRPPPLPVAAAPEAPPVAAILLRGLMLLGAATGTGGLAFLTWLLRPTLARAGAPADSVRRGRAWLAAPLLLCAVAAPLMLVDQAQAAFGQVDLTGLTRVLNTRYGDLLLARAGLALTLAVVATPPARERRLRDGVCAALGAALLLNFSLGGHAAADPAPLLPVLADAIHLGTTTLWVGGLLAFAALLPGALRSTPEARRPDLLRALFARFSALALASVALLAATGTYAALRNLGALTDLWTTSYGLALLAKLIAFSAMLLFGAYHLLVARPALDAWVARAAEPTRQWPLMLGRTLRIEAALGLIAILAAGTLTSLAPPIDMSVAATVSDTQPTPTAIRVPTVTPGPTRTPVPSRPFDQTQAAGDLQVRLEVSPANIGDDRFRVTVTDKGGAPVETQLVRLSFMMLEMDMGTNQLVATPEARASYAVSGAPLSMIGKWQVTVTVRRAGVRDVEAVFTVPVGE